MNQKILTCAGLLFAARTFAATALHHYTFDSAGVTDSAGTANGTLLNGAAVASGRLNLDGNDDYVQFDQKIVPTNGNFSVAFFAQETSPQFDYAEILSQGISGGPGFYIGYDPSHNFRIGDNLLNTDLPFPSDGLRHHYAVTATDDETQLFIDGCLIETFGPISMTDIGDDTRLGAQFDPYAEFFHGNMDELWVFSGALTADEVAALAGRPRLRIEVSPLSLRWNSATNVTYQVQCCSNLTTSAWIDLGAPIPGNGTTNYITDAVIQPAKFYRLVVLP